MFIFEKLLLSRERDSYNDPFVWNVLPPPLDDYRQSQHIEYTLANDNDEMSPTKKQATYMKVFHQSFFSLSLLFSVCLLCAIFNWDEFEGGEGR